MSKIIKIMLLGDSSVGKSCLMYQYCKNSFVASYISTVGIDFQVKELMIDNQPVKVQVWDTAGQEQFHSINYSYYRGADGIVLVYDVTNKSSFSNINKWLRDIKQYASDSVDVLIVGNKLDLMNKRQISLQEGKELAQTQSLDFYETSAKTREGVDDAFLTIVQKIFYRMKVESERNAAALSNNQNKVDLTQRSSSMRNSAKQCCP